MLWTFNTDQRIKECELRDNPIIIRVNKFDEESAKKFADYHDLTLASPRQIRIAPGIKPVIWVSKNKLQLQDLDDKNSKPFSLDFETLDKEKKNTSLLHKCFSKFDQFLNRNV